MSFKKVNWKKVGLDILFLVLIVAIVLAASSCEKGEVYEYKGKERNQILEFYSSDFTSFDNVMVHVLNDIDTPIYSMRYIDASSFRVPITTGEGFHIIINNDEFVDFTYQLTTDKGVVIWRKNGSCDNECSWSLDFDGDHGIVEDPI